MQKIDHVFQDERFVRTFEAQFCPLDSVSQRTLRVWLRAGAPPPEPWRDVDLAPVEPTELGGEG